MNKSFVFSPEIAMYYLQQMHNRPHPQRRMRVLFLVQNDFVWTKQVPVYDVLAADEEVEPIIVLLPSYSATDLSAGKATGAYEESYWHFFHDRYADVYDFTNVLDLRIFQPDYIFLALPYEELRPLPGTHTSELAQIAKLCYLDYGIPGTKFFLRTWSQMPFFSYLTFYFCDSMEEKREFEATNAYAVGAGLQHFETLGYPEYEAHLAYQGVPKQRRRILWTPRWTVEGAAGGSHFLAYKDLFAAFAERHGNEDFQFAIRPHPFMFDNFIQRGLMTVEEVRAYKNMLTDRGIELDEGKYELFDALTSTDILLTDFSSICMPFFLLNRPIVYCPYDPDLTEDYAAMTGSSYIAESWAQIEHHLEHLMRGEDPLAEYRTDTVAAFRTMHMGAAKRIVERLKKDHAASQYPAAIYLPEIEKWIFDQKKSAAAVIGGGNGELLQYFCAQEWYPLYLALLPLRVHNENLVWGEEQILAKLQEKYAAANDAQRRSCLVLAMLLFADPLTLSVPLEIDRWAEGLYQDIQAVFRQHRTQLGVV
ncbi:CDP-glycerol--poly(glycerophosphate) glycerophosphotransferase [Selenomonas sp. oral taxon 138]|uniref:CDP-glycerol--poly(glycerophosphate) glycerophosphotransferase n=1 Tax=Selenomonas sp. oral taxon 138 TaxID=712532 RepID=UPI0002A21292|nr:CDP-glycerol--poly(glycerophosphate) glycerophosphotransferase [Selenomonas sp. oral taxon 138]EKX96629.1 CDP-glycerol:poly(glycerophosphate) glycerophosphotransferase [Selenomonas sp. oral taxon 138 str. F0429]